jgi:hypothetical protein
MATVENPHRHSYVETNIRTDFSSVEEAHRPSDFKGAVSVLYPIPVDRITLCRERDISRANHDSIPLHTI